MRKAFYHVSHITYRKSGFGLLEVLLSSGILVVTIAAVITLGSIATRGSVLNQSRIQAYNLAQEGMEAVRAIRDTNYIDQDTNTNWDTGLIDTTTLDNCDVEYGDYTPPLSSIAQKRWKIVCTGTTSPDPRFTRKVNISPVADSKRVDVTVSWDEFGRKHSVNLNTILTNWRLEG